MNLRANEKSLLIAPANHTRELSIGRSGNCQGMRGSRACPEDGDEKVKAMLVMKMVVVMIMKVRIVLVMMRGSHACPEDLDGEHSLGDGDSGGDYWW